MAAAANAGFDAIGLSASEHARLTAHGISNTQLQAALENYGMRIAELEVVLGFAADANDLQRDPSPGLRHTDRDTQSRLFELAATFGARHLQAVGTFHRDTLEDGAVDAFARLCDRAAQVDLLVALEFVPGTNIPDAGTALELIRAAGRPNGGVCVDAWHHFRGLNQKALLRAIPPELIYVIQLDDGPMTPVDDDYLTDTIHNRQPPGGGEFPLAEFIVDLWNRGVHAPISVEVLRGEPLDRSPANTANVLAKATRHILETASRTAVRTKPARSSTNLGLQASSSTPNPES